MEESFLTSVGLPVALGIIMLGMGLTLVIDDFKRIVLYPGPVLLGLANQMVFLPIIGFAVASSFDLEPEHAVGIMILAACPGGVTSNLFAHLARGNTALSITLTALSSSLAVLTIPLIVNFGIGEFMGADAKQIDVLETVLKVIGITILPISIGMLLRHYKPSLSHKAERPVRILSTILLIVIVAGAILQERDIIVDAFKTLGPATLALNVATMLLGFLSARLLLSDIRMGVSISMESGLQNGTLGIAIAAEIIKNSKMALAPAIYSLVMFATGFIAVIVFGRMVKRYQLKHPPGAAES